jgi:hypothetical protein
VRPHSYNNTPPRPSSQRSSKNHWIIKDLIINKLDSCHIPPLTAHCILHSLSMVAYRDKPNPPPWRTSDAKKALALMLENDVDGTIHAMHHSAVYMMSPLFQAYDPKNFQTNLKNLKEATQKDKSIVAFHQKAFEHDRNLVPTKDLTPRGYPRFDVSAAKALLARDVKEGKHKEGNIRIIDFQQTRPEYRSFPLAVFRKHIYQEEYNQNARGYWMHKNQKKKENSSSK